MVPPQSTFTLQLIDYPAREIAASAGPYSEYQYPSVQTINSTTQGDYGHVCLFSRSLVASHRSRRVS